MIVVSGGVVSTENVRLAGVGSGFPAESFARTSNVWLPSVSVEVVKGLVHGPHAPASTRHSNDAPPTDAVNSNVGVLSVVVPVGPAVIVVSTVGALTVMGATPLAPMTVTPLPAPVTELV